MPNYSGGDVLLVRYPFTDLSGGKVRPASVTFPFLVFLFLHPFDTFGRASLPPPSPVLCLSPRPLSPILRLSCQMTFEIRICNEIAMKIKSGVCIMVP